MPLTYTLISSNVLSSNASIVTFSSIPQTFTDLVIRSSIRSNQGGTFGGGSIKLMDANGLYSFTRINGIGSAGVNSNRTSSQNEWILVGSESVNADASTANTFSSHEFYFPNYTTSRKKVASLFNATETNNTVAYLNVYAALVQNTSAVTNITITSGNQFLSNSSFYLYGIKNS